MGHIPLERLAEVSTVDEGKAVESAQLKLNGSKDFPELSSVCMVELICGF